MSASSRAQGSEIMTCEDVCDLLFLYASDELEPDERDSVDEHLLECETCRQALEEHKVLRRALPTGFLNRKLFYYSIDA